MDNRILGMPRRCFNLVVIVCIVGIVIGSFLDFQINVALKNVNNIGAFFASYGLYFSYCLYPAAGMCLYRGLKKKGYRKAGLALLVIGYFLAIYYTNNYSGSKLRALLGYKVGENVVYSILSYLLIAVLYIWPMVVCNIVLDDSDADKLIAVGTTILVAGIVSDNVNLWLKQVASRPRYKYLITLPDPMSEFRGWWQMVPYKAGSNDSFKSWPSGNMTIAAMMFSLPMLTDSLKRRSERKNYIAFVFACVFVLVYAYNRIHMTNHFLSDVCFGTLITYLIHASIGCAFFSKDK